MRVDAVDFDLPPERIALRPAAALLIAVSLYWFVERAFDVDVPILAAFRNFV